MLAVALWFVVAILLLAMGLIDGAATFARAGVHAAAEHAVEAALHDAVADYRNALRDAIAAQVVRAPYSAAPQSLGAFAPAGAALPNPLVRTIPAGAGGGPHFTVAYAVTPTTASAPACPRFAPPGSGPDAVDRLQCSEFIQESRVSLHVTVRILDAAGQGVLLQREEYVTLRLFAEPPYSAPVGRLDASAQRSDGPAHEGDLGAVAPIHVRYECHDGAGSCANAAPPDPDGELLDGVRWSDGNQPSP